VIPCSIRLCNWASVLSPVGSVFIMDENDIVFSWWVVKVGSIKKSYTKFSNDLV
jgi:hypothetical protein